MLENYDDIPKIYKVLREARNMKLRFSKKNRSIHICTVMSNTNKSPQNMNSSSFSFPHHYHLYNDQVLGIGWWWMESVLGELTTPACPPPITNHSCSIFSTLMHFFELHVNSIIISWVNKRVCHRQKWPNVKSCVFMFS